MNDCKSGGKLELKGVYSNGYGNVPKSVMKDKDLSIEEKAIYSYLCSYAGSGNTAFPSVSLMCSDLNIGENRFYKHRKQLVDKNYITIGKEKQSDGTWQNNIYTLVNNPYCQFEGMENECMEFEGIENEGTNNNSSNNNNLNKEQDIKADALPIFSLYNLKIIDQVTHDTKISEVIKSYANAYEFFYRKKHPNLKENQLKRITDLIEAIEVEYPVVWSEVIKEFFMSDNTGNGNINYLFSGDQHEGVAAALLKNMY